MNDSFTHILTQEEFTELQRLVEVLRNAGDVQYAAFSVLCPTGEEGAFDEHMCEIYTTLHDAGLVEGDSDGGAFYFRDLTQAGIRYVEHVEEGFEGALWETHLAEEDNEEVSDLADVAKSPQQQEQWQSEDKRPKIHYQNQGETSDQANNQSAQPLELQSSEGKSVRFKGLGVRIALVVMVGFLAGFIGGVVGAYLFTALLT